MYVIFWRKSLQEARGKGGRKGGGRRTEEGPTLHFIY